MVSSKFCRRSAMFLTVRNRLVSGSSPDQHNKKKTKKFLRTYFLYAEPERLHISIDRRPERSSMDVWLVLVKEMSPPLPPESVSVVTVPSLSVWDLEN